MSRSVADRNERLDAIGVAIVPASGALLAWLCAVHPGTLPVWAPWEFSWAAFLGTGFGLWWYATGLVRTAPAARPAPWRRTLFLVGVLITYAVWQTRFQYMAEHMFFLNRAQHMVMHHLGPFLIALAWPGETILRGMPPKLRRLVLHRAVTRVVAVVQQPVPAAVLFDGLLLLWLYPPVHLRAMLDVRLYVLMNLSMVGDGLLFWALVLDPRPKPPARLSYAARIILVMAIQVPQIMAGAFIGLSSRDLYPVYELCGRLFPGIGPGLDQQLGGLIVYYPGAMMSAVAALILFGRLWRAETDGQLLPPWPSV